MALSPVDIQVPIIAVTDSRALIEAINGRTPSDDLLNLWWLLSRISSLHIVWVSSHCNYAPNDAADVLAAAECEMDQSSVPIFHEDVCREVRRGRATKQKLPPLDCDLLTKLKVTVRDAETSMNQLLAGQAAWTAKYMKMIRKADSSLCKHCNSGEEEDVEHYLLYCVRWSTIRNKIFGAHQLTQTTVEETVTKQQEGVVRYLLETGVVGPKSQGTPPVPPPVGGGTA